MQPRWWAGPTLVRAIEAYRLEAHWPAEFSSGQAMQYEPEDSHPLLAQSAAPILSDI